MPNLTIQVNDAELGSTDPTGTFFVGVGVETPIAAIENVGSAFVNWTVISGDGVLFGNANDPETIVKINVDNDAVIQANFVYTEYTLTVTNDGHGSSFPIDVLEVRRGAPTEISAVPAEGYAFVNWTVSSGDAEFINADNASTSVILWDDSTILANFTPIQTYTLPDIKMKGETYSIKLSSGITGLETPSRNLLVSMGNRSEKLEGDNDTPDNPTKQTIQNIDFEFIDKDNFFYDLLTQAEAYGGSVGIQVWKNGTILEFDGKVDFDSMEFPETYVDATSARRHASFSAIASISKLEDISAETMINAIKASSHIVDTHYLQVQRMFAEFIYQMGNTDEDLALPVIPNHDFKYFRAWASEETTWAGLYIDTLDDCFDEMLDEYKTAKELLVGLAKNFGFAPVVYYDSDNLCYRLKLLTQRSHATNYGTFLALKDGGKKISVKKPTGFSFAHDEDFSAAYWDNGKMNKFFSYAEEPDPAPDYDRETILWFGIDPYVNSIYCIYDSAWTKIAYLTYYNYTVGDWNENIEMRDEFSTVSFLNYFIHIWYEPHAGYNRTVKGFSENELGTVIQMHDGEETRDFMITSFERNYNAKEETYDLFEI